MATKTSCLPNLLVGKLLKSGIHLENNNYIFTKRSAPRQPRDVSRLGLYCVVASVAILVYVNSVRGDFVHDDIVAIRRNADVVGRHTSISRIFTNDFWGRPIVESRSHKSYRPLCVLTFRLNYLLGGLDPLGYHLVNVALHAVACVLLTLLCEQVLLYSTQMSVVAGTLFATHPIHTEAVSSIVGRADVMACVLYLAAFLLYHRSVEVNKSGQWAVTRRPALLVSSLGLAAAAMLVKEHGVSVLGVCLLYDLTVLSRTALTRMLRKKTLDKNCLPTLKRTLVVTLWAVLVVYTRVWLMGGSLPVFTDEDNPAAASPFLLTRVLTYCYLYALNAWLLFCPLTLSYDWQMGSVPLVASLGDVRNLASVGLLSTLVILAVLGATQTKGLCQRRLSVGLLLLVVPFLPASNLFFPVGFVIAERILYIPSVGFILLIAQGVEWMSRCPQWWRTSVSLSYSALLLCGLWAGRAVTRNNVWRSRQALFRSGLESHPQNAKMHYNYGNFMKDIGQKDDAIRHYWRAIELWPSYASAHNNLGTLVNKTSEAEWHYREAIRINSNHAGAYFNLGNLLSQTGRLMEAVEELRRSIHIDPHFPDPHTSLAVILSQLGRHQEAERHYRTVVTLKPSDANALNNLAVYLGNQGKQTEALRHYQWAYTVEPDHHLAMVNAARLLRQADRNQEAQQLLERALIISRDAHTLGVAGIFFFNTDQPERAATLFEELLRLEPHNQQAAIHYAQALSRVERYERGEEVLRAVLGRDRRDTESLHQLANVLGLQRKHKEALQVLEEVIALGGDARFQAVVYCQMGNHYKDQGSMDDAFKSYQKAVSLDTEVGDAHLNLGVFQHFMNNLSQAKYHYMEAKRLLPGNQLVIDNLRKLCRILSPTEECPDVYR